MAEEKELTGIERELVLQYLRDDNVPLTVTLEEKPLQTETEVTDDKARVPDSKERVPASAVFPVAIRSQQMTVLNQGIILLKNDVTTVQQVLGKTVRVQFYFNHLGLYFITTMKECSQGLAIVVPSSIKRVVDNPFKQEYELTATISFVSNDKSVVKIECVPSPRYQLFVQPKWGDIELEKQHEAKSYLERIVAQSRSGQSGSIGSGLHLFPVCRFLTDDSVEQTPAAVEGRCLPLTILFVDDKRIVLGSREKKEPLALEADYNIQLVFSLEANKLLKRTVSVTCSVESEYTADGDNTARCFVCKFNAVKEEDVRFLYERAYGKKLDS